MLIGLEHLCEEVVRAGDRDLRLHEDLHAFHHILPRQVVKSNFPLDVIVDRQSLRDNQGLVIGYTT